MKHTKETFHKYNGPMGWVIIALGLWLLLGHLTDQVSRSYEADKVEQRR